MQRKELERVVVITAFPDFVKDKIEQMKCRMNGVLSVTYLEDKQFQKDLLPDVQHTLFFADSRETEDILQKVHAYVVGYEHERNQGVPLSATEYVFSDIEDLSADDIFYVWNRVTGQPCDVLETEHLLVRETTVEDVDTFYELYRDSEITEYMEPLFLDPEEERAYQAMYIRNIYGLYGYGVWTVIEKESGGIVGRAGVAPREGCEEPELGFVIGRYEHERNQGVPLSATEYVFSDIEDLSADDIFYVWNRVTGQPCDVLETEHLLVRETTVEDVDTFYELYRDSEITEYMEPLFLDPEEERAYQAMYIRNIYGLYGYGVWTVIEKESGGIVGRAGVAPREGCEEPELGFVIGREWQRKGYAYEVCKAILDYVKTAFSIDRVIAVVHQDNQASIGLCEKLGFAMEDRVLQENHITFLKDL